ncbi:extensin-like [Penaeus japonicus]|uniref:extensin-like n=1 Tax=Penaeus japonicus TaxID=27405 RepID=UPI001C70F788|nr:extensin-like [Penaeus japonicus]
MITVHPPAVTPAVTILPAYPSCQLTVHHLLTLPTRHRPPPSLGSRHRPSPCQLAVTTARHPAGLTPSPRPVTCQLSHRHLPSPGLTIHPPPSPGLMRHPPAVTLRLLAHHLPTHPSTLPVLTPSPPPTRPPLPGSPPSLPTHPSTPAKAHIHPPCSPLWAHHPTTTHPPCHFTPSHHHPELTIPPTTHHPCQMRRHPASRHTLPAHAITPTHPSPCRHHPTHPPVHPWAHHSRPPVTPCWDSPSHPPPVTPGLTPSPPPHPSTLPTRTILPPIHPGLTSHHHPSTPGAHTIHPPHPVTPAASYPEPPVTPVELTIHPVTPAELTPSPPTRHPCRPPIQAARHLWAPRRLPPSPCRHHHPPIALPILVRITSLLGSHHHHPTSSAPGLAISRAAHHPTNSRRHNTRRHPVGSFHPTARVTSSPSPPPSLSGSARLPPPALWAHHPPATDHLNLPSPVTLLELTVTTHHYGLTPSATPPVTLPIAVTRHPSPCRSPIPPPPVTLLGSPIHHHPSLWARTVTRHRHPAGLAYLTTVTAGLAVTPPANHPGAHRHHPPSPGLTVTVTTRAHAVTTAVTWAHASHPPAVTL